MKEKLSDPCKFIEVAYFRESLFVQNTTLNGTFRYEGLVGDLLTLEMDMQKYCKPTNLCNVPLNATKSH